MLVRFAFKTTCSGHPPMSVKIISENHCVYGIGKDMMQWQEKKAKILFQRKIGNIFLTQSSWILVNLTHPRKKNYVT